FNGETPLSLCIINSGKPARGAIAERREGLNIVHWSSGKHGFMVIGDVPHKDLNRIAHKLRRQLS
ncbi:MAG: anti-sigma factor, partial [Methyloligellaceae bacterium]